MRLDVMKLAVVKLVEVRLVVMESAGAELAEGSAEAQPVERLAEVIEAVRQVKVPYPEEEVEEVYQR
jgi:hypothetical protein